MVGIASLPLTPINLSLSQLLVQLALMLKLSKQAVGHTEELQDFWRPQQLVAQDLVAKDLQVFYCLNHLVF